MAGASHLPLYRPTLLSSGPSTFQVASCHAKPERERLKTENSVICSHSTVGYRVYTSTFAFYAMRRLHEISVS